MNNRVTHNNRSFLWMEYNWIYSDLGWSWRMCVPTKYRHSLTNVQALSIFCPIFVQVLSLSKMDKYWRNSKTILSTMSRYFYLTKVGQKLDMDKILTNLASNSLASPQHSIDKTWTKIWTSPCPIFVQYEKKLGWSKYSLDKSWTNIKIFRHIVDKFLTKLSKISINLTNIGHWQNLDKPWTNIGQNLYICPKIVQNLSNHPFRRSTQIM